MPTRRSRSRPPPRPPGGTSALPAQRQQKPVAVPSMQVRQRLLQQLQDVLGSCDDLFTQHGPDCACETCGVASNLVGSVRVFAMLLAVS